MEAYIIFLMLISILAGFLAHSKGRSFLGWCLLGLIINPIIVCIILAFLSSRKDYEVKVYSYVANAKEGIDVNSPICLESCSLFTNNEHDRTGLILNIRNLSDRVITAVDFICEGYSSSDSKLTFNIEGDYIIKLDNISIDPYSTYSNDRTSIIELLDPSIARITLTVHEITFDDGSIFINEPCIEKVKEDEIPSYAIALARKHVNNARVFGEDHEHYWICPCGGVNLKNTHICYRCKKEKDETFKVMTRDNFRPIWRLAKEQGETK
ncbi:hypothetical protein M2475_000608 [Breznakia sp. PF5-3]|uniref:hypothetical protein n=1 Tax=unclassified Breznakia TaxID=2623764 RepID=UPI00240691E7|nr:MULTISPECIES: hypothetical protein [unclassified Breznakia]MDF9824361.1 hypothetical protein [Breznakia sp. PM6-1]MDF9835048.1 hypothetical protein [Breznakia sp. PF5-3]MDF9837781.1 hypothetical protein [Breznakia sp. PFB2-8]MDF9859660.1 hypothetical protein [Breznakia sp. PH5-24]